jgi:pimeloyl-ACP methyl ester carboxylesterase
MRIVPGLPIPFRTSAQLRLAEASDGAATSSPSSLRSQATVEASTAPKTVEAWVDLLTAQLNARSSIIETRVGPMEVATRGQGPAVLTVHGYPGGHDQAMFISESVGSEDFRFIAPSRPGYLRTPLSTGRTPEEQADAFAAMLDELGIQKTAVIGASGGGPAAIAFALRYPNRVSALVLMCAVTQGHRTRTATAERVVFTDEALFSDWRAAQENPAIWIPKLIDGSLVHLVAPYPEKVAMLDRMARTFMPIGTRTEGFMNDVTQLRAMDDFPLEQLRVPTLVLYGTNDSNVPASHSETAARQIPHATARAYPGADHFFFVEHAETVWPEVRTFLEQHPAA